MSNDDPFIRVIPCEFKGPEDPYIRGQQYQNEAAAIAIEKRLTTYNACFEKLKAQKRYCIEKELPIFADGLFCPYCHELIYDKITPEKAASELITGCPECHKSFCE